MRSESVEGGTWLVYILHMHSRRGRTIPQNSLSFAGISFFFRCGRTPKIALSLRYATANPPAWLGVQSASIVSVNGSMHGHTDHKFAGWDCSQLRTLARLTPPQAGL
ncbi:hypothetical protein TWF225_001813 [Orbilia oligospora]|uniref:Uncharacterized protein n=1 Tax=Orbilia oligospora TaxID=2813651 RepID=A0A7C8P774_ORBOL|nr:hypothetical protein TWF751_002125 [Orbilia oligospora]KAF3190845.1 hypothetical protein TWF225_001813 [Orbilia oligospora]KAF3262306.1 hypothetical protein TWF217_004372 [Orbilia oligospora]KAF3265196.1 hypothetical protein TWF128_000484 [Orbilia oligospora]KAF3293749.1 hypothetical protein TWF132_004340 [Orbilia oligospora]